MREAARQAFLESGLSYGQVYEHLELLRGELERELAAVYAEGGMELVLAARHAVRRTRPDGEIDAFFLYVDGRYFKGREAISFNSGGFVGFAGWAADVNVAPLVAGFMAAVEKIEAQCRDRQAAATA